MNPRFLLTGEGRMRQPKRERCLRQNNVHGVNKKTKVTGGPHPTPPPPAFQTEGESNVVFQSMLDLDHDHNLLQYH